MAYYPLNVDLNGRKCVVIGGGAVAERKVEMLREFGAVVVVISPELAPSLKSLAANEQIVYIPGAYRPGMLDGAFLVIAATDDNDTNRVVSADAQEKNIPVNVVDDPDLCTFFVPAVVKRGDLTISVSTSGKSPALARRIREKLETDFGPEYGELADLMGELRNEVKARYENPTDRHSAYQRILNSSVLGLLAQGKRDEAKARARKCIL